MILTFLETLVRRTTTWYISQSSLISDRFDMSLWEILDLLKKKMVRNIYTTCYLVWSQFWARKLSRKSLEWAPIFSKLQANKNIWRGFSLLLTKAEFLQDYSPQISHVNLPCASQFHWILSLTTANMEKELPQVSFLAIFRATTLPHNFWVATLLWSYSCKKGITKKWNKDFWPKNIL